GNYKHAQLNRKNFKEIQVLYGRQKKSVQDFIPIGSAEDKRRIEEMNKKEVGEDTLMKEKARKQTHNDSDDEHNFEEDTSKKRKRGPRIKRMSKKKKTDSDLEEEEDLKTFLKIINNNQSSVLFMVLLSSIIIIEYLVNISKRRAFWSLNEDILKITILTTNTPCPSRKIRRIRACTHQRPQRKQAQYTVFREDQYDVLEIRNEYNILEDIKRGPYSKKLQYVVSNPLDTPRYGVSVLAIHKRPRRNKDPYSISKRNLYAVFKLYNVNILEDIEHETSSHFHLDASFDSSSRHSSVGHAISDSHCDSLTTTFVRSSRKRHRSPTSSVPIASPVHEALSHVRADLLPPPKRNRDFDLGMDLEVSLEDGYESNTPKERGLGVDIEDSYEPYTEPDIDPDIQPDIDECTRGMVEVEVDPRVRPVVDDDVHESIMVDVLDHVTANEAIEGHSIAEVDLEFTNMIKRIGTLKQDNVRLRGILDVER
nr:hypothetical protein [Tanacetum cinerariifolium]